MKHFRKLIFDIRTPSFQALFRGQAYLPSTEFLKDQLSKATYEQMEMVCQDWQIKLVSIHRTDNYNAEHGIAIHCVLGVVAVDLEFYLDWIFCTVRY